MKSPRISLLLAGAMSVAIGLSAYYAYLQPLGVLPDDVGDGARALCAQMPHCLSVETKVIGRPDRTRRVCAVTFDMRRPMGDAERDHLSEQIKSPTLPPPCLVEVAHLLNGQPPGRPAPDQKRRAAPASGVRQ